MNHFLNRSMPSAGSLIFLPLLLVALLLPPVGVNAQSPRIEVGENVSPHEITHDEMLSTSGNDG